MVAQEQVGQRWAGTVAGAADCSLGQGQGSWQA